MAYPDGRRDHQPFLEYGYAMEKNTNLELKDPRIPTPVSDSLTDLLQEGTRRMLMKALKAEVQEFLSRHATLKDGKTRSMVVRDRRSRQN